MKKNRWWDRRSQHFIPPKKTRVFMEDVLMIIMAFLMFFLTVFALLVVF